jgi:cytochrome b involved in lipid metabolism
MIQIQLPMSMTATAKLETKQTKKAGSHHPQLSDVVMAKSEALLQANNNNNPKKTSSSPSLWWIHGKGYDLSDFVERHPGGIEAILLGKGRDCTAMVESYHAFSTQHWRVLEKYRVQQHPSEKETGPHSKFNTCDDNHQQEDFFYKILKERVTATLKEKGIDPVHDRGASTQRILYYCLVFALWIYTGYLHLSVRIICFCNMVGITMIARIIHTPE